MHITKTLVMAAVTLGFFATTEQIIAQNGFENPAQEFSQMEDRASIDSRPSYSSRLNPSFTPPSAPRSQYPSDQRPPSGTSPAQLPPITSSSLQNNELRGSVDSGAPSSVLEPPSGRYDAQPLPPKPPVTSTKAQFERPSFSSSNFSDSTQNPPSKFEDPGNATQLSPMEQLNPARLIRGIPEDQTIRQSDTQVIPIHDTLQAAQASQTPRIPNNSADDSRVVSSSFTSPPQQQQNFGQVQRQAQPRQDFSNRGQQRQQPRQNFANPNQQQTSQQRPQQPLNQSNLSSGSSSNANVSRQLLTRYDVGSSQQALPGLPVDLESLLRSTPTRYRMAMVQQYWETYFDWSNLQNRRMHSGWLAALSSPRSQSEQSLLTTAKSMAQNELTAAEIQLARSQSKLQQLSRSSHPQLLPLPMDQPLVTKYNTHYEWYASRNRIPAKLKGINEMLPRTYELISSRADTVQQAESARSQATQAYKSGQLGLSNVLESGRVWHSAMQGFSGTVVSYNQAISDYALTITPAEKPISELVSMLVAKPKSIKEVAQRNSILNRQQNQTAQNSQSGGILSRPQPDQEYNQRVSRGQQNQAFGQQVNNTSLAPQGQQRIARQNPINQRGNDAGSRVQQSPFQSQSVQSGNSNSFGAGTSGSNRLANGPRRSLGDGQSQSNNAFRSPSTPPETTPGTPPNLRQRSTGSPPEFKPPGQFKGGSSVGGGSSQGQSGGQFRGGNFGG